MIEGGLRAEEAPDLVYDVVMQAWKCAFGDIRVVYLSGPITTGSRYFDQLRSGQPHASKQVFEENCADLISAAAVLRKKHREVVVEPASLSVPGWDQSDYLRLWETFIARHARTVKFMPGWQYSAGCAAEYACATECGISTETLESLPLDTRTALKMLDEAVHEVRTGKGVAEIDRLISSIDSAIMRIKTSCGHADQ